MVCFKVIVDQFLPRHWKTEDVEVVHVGEVLHLALRHVW